MDVKRQNPTELAPLFIFVLAFIIMFFGGILFMINQIMPKESLGFLNTFFGIFIGVVIIMVILTYLGLGRVFKKRTMTGKQSGLNDYTVRAKKQPTFTHNSGKVTALICGSCGAQISIHDKFCLECGIAL